MACLELAEAFGYIGPVDHEMRAEELESVREILIVSHRTPHIVLHRRGGDGTWAAHEATRGQVLEVQAVGAQLAVDEIYRDFEAA